MNCEELQINDWIEYNGLNQKVKEISGLDNEVYLTIDECIDCTQVNPILITAEILEKNGFELYGNEWQYHTEDDKGHILIEFSKDNKLSINVYNSLDLKDNKGRADLVHFVRDWCDSFYVHQLQHALRLCGIKKEIEL